MKWPISKEMGKLKYRVTCFQCEIEYISENKILECSKCNSRFIENVKMQRIEYISRELNFQIIWIDWCLILTIRKSDYQAVPALPYGPGQIKRGASSRWSFGPNAYGAVKGRRPSYRRTPV